MTSHMAYLARVFDVYSRPSRGPLAFWHERPELNERAFDGLQYFMTFAGKAAYPGPFDPRGVPLLDYRGRIGRQYNPIAVAQYGLARFNRYDATATLADRRSFEAAADWLVNALRPNTHGVRVWMHDFDWPYRTGLTAPWYSGLAQGVGVSLLARAWRVTGSRPYADAAAEALAAFFQDVGAGGVAVRDHEGRLWLEEYLVEPPSHILNGFIWALWGAYDAWRLLGLVNAATVFEEGVETIAANIHRYEAQSWSLYELHGNGPTMPASAYYHRLHIVQLRVLHRLTRREVFRAVADRWQRHSENRLGRTRALVRKVWFKLRHY